MSTIYSGRYAIVVMAVGDKYRRQLSYVLSSLKKYANKCEADLQICTEVPDSSYRRSLLSQKLLLPKIYKKYEWIFFVDLDVMISETALPVFDEINDDFAFSATADQRDSLGFKNTVTHVWRQIEILKERHNGYFRSRGFPDNAYLQSSINGGAFLCRPCVIAPLFEEAYWSDLPTTSHEEAIMAYISQANGLFKPLNPKFNTQFIHEISAENPALAVRWTYGYHFRILKKLQDKLPPQFLKSLYPPVYRQFVQKKLDETYILHFAGGYPFIGL